MTVSNKFNLNKIKKILAEKGFTIKKKRSGFFLKDLKSFYLTTLFSFVLILISTLVPLSVNIKEDINVSKSTIDNNSNVNFQKVLDGKDINQKNVDEGLDLENLFEDIFSIEEVPTDTVRLSAKTINQLFKDTKYNLETVRKKKIVKPINLSLLPSEIRNIESTKKKKNLFIKIVLPLILEENKRIEVDRKKLFKILNKNMNSDAEKKWLNTKFKQYGVLNRDLSTLKVRMDIVPVSLSIAQAAKESGWGTSRFAIEGNALFGQWTWSGEGIKPAGVDSEEKHKVMKFKVLKASVRAYQRNLNTHGSYKEFRSERAKMRDNDEELDSLILADYLDKYAATGKEYTKIIKQIIKQNSLKDFDKVKLLPSSLQLKNII
ncbi:glucosaminidase domain-containing protein [Candidatus Pelagibacter sp.]|nr:glucosaminidase domain-containing protein [Candidatus Pelagibacter sp.]